MSHLILLLWIQSLLRSASAIRPCPFEGRWGGCQCERIQMHAGQVTCTDLEWAPTIPSVPNVTDSGFRITGLKIVRSKVILLKGDTFKGQNIVSLDLSFNEVNFVNMHAFRFLESSLIQLTLNHNLLSEIPVKALSDLHQLQYLWLSNNRIGHIDGGQFEGSNLRNLRFVYLDRNQISFIPHGAFSDIRLDTLTLSGNRINSVANDAFPATLRYLTISNNALDEIPFESFVNLTNLEHLELSGNNISEINVILPDLIIQKKITLDLNSNRIRRLAIQCFKNFRFLKKLDLSYNELREIPHGVFNDVKFLGELDLSFNRIKSIHPETFRSFQDTLTVLNLEDNHLHVLPPAIYFCRSLKYLNLKSNLLTKIDSSILQQFRGTLSTLLLSYNRIVEVPKRALEDMPKLTHLDLSKNHITGLGKLAFGTLSDYGNSLIRLHLAGNRIKAISDPEAFAYMSAVAYLDLSFNEISEISNTAFQLLSGLERLFLQNNLLESIPVSALGDLKQLRDVVLDNNFIRAVPNYALMGLRSLEELSLRNNLLYAVYNTSFPSKGLGRLQRLKLSGNQIGYLSQYGFHNLTNLQQILLDNNQLKTIKTHAFHYLPKLEYLDISRNMIGVVQPLAFSNMPLLRVMSLRWNSLTRFPVNAFFGVPRLDELYLSHNKFKTFRADFLLEFKNLKILDLGYNHLTQIDELKAITGSLERLVLAHNRFTTVCSRCFSDFDKLKFLDLSNNFIQVLSPNAFYNSRQISHISLAHNSLVQIGKGTFSVQESFDLIDLNSNQINFIDEGAFGLENVRQILAPNNQLTQLPHLALYPIRHSLQTMDLTQNRITNLDPELWQGLKSLSYLKLARNRIQKLESGSFQGLSKLRTLDLSHNRIRSWDSKTFANISYYLETLDLANTGLGEIPDLNDLGLHLLNLSYNHITKVDENSLRGIKKIEVLDLSHNQLSDLSPNALPTLLNLKHLNLSHNPIQRVEAKHLRYLHKLESLKLNDLPRLSYFDPSAFFALRNLQELDLYNLPSYKWFNLTETLRFLPPLRRLHILITEPVLKDQLFALDSRRLNHLHIQSEVLNRVELDAFRSLRGFRVYLAITHSNLSSLPAGIFDTFRYVNYLDLSLAHNKFRVINPFQDDSQENDVRRHEAANNDRAGSWGDRVNNRIPVLSRQGTILTGLNLEGNPLECKCALSWITKWFTHLRQGLTPDVYQDHLARWEAARCAGPKQLRGRPVVESLGGLTCASGGLLLEEKLWVVVMIVLYLKYLFSNF